MKNGQYGKDVIAESLASNRLGAFAIVFFVFAAAAPLTVVSGVMPTAFAVTGVVGLPLVYLGTGVVLGVFAVGYVTMARHVANAGGLYAYIAAGLGRVAGVGAAWVALLAYNCLQVGLYGLFGVAAAPLIEMFFGVTGPWWLWAGVGCLVVAVLGLLQVDVNGRVLSVLLIGEVAFILLFDVWGFLDRVNHTAAVSFAALNPAHLPLDRVGATAVIAVLSFIGFESAVVYIEESRNPNRTVPLATFATLVVMGALYAFSAWAFTVRVGADDIVRVATDSLNAGTNLMFEETAVMINPRVAVIGLTLLVTGVFAALLSFHATTARYAFALGREGVLPSAVGRTSQRTGAPLVGSLLQSAVGLATIGLYAGMGWDPVVQLFFWLGTSGGFGVLLLLAGSSLAVIGFFSRHREHLVSRFRSFVCPTVAFTALCIMITLAVLEFHHLLGVDQHSVLRYALPAAFGVVFVIGGCWGLILRTFRPEVYRRIGMGAKAATVPLFSTATAVNQ